MGTKVNLNHKIMPSEYVYTTSFKPVGWYVKESGCAQGFLYSTFFSIFMFNHFK